MTEAPNNATDDSPGWEQRAVTLTLGAFSLLLAIAFTIGALLADSDDLGGWGGRVMISVLALSCWCFGGAYTLEGLIPGRNKRSERWLSIGGFLCFGLFVIGLLVRPNAGPGPESVRPSRFNTMMGPTMAVLLAGYLSVVVVYWVTEFSGRLLARENTRARKRESLGGLVFAWPVLLLGVLRPFQSLTIFGLALGCTYGGQRLGETWGSPYWGASLGMGFLLASGLGVLAWADRKQ
jgi:hypothetical protein